MRKSIAIAATLVVGASATAVAAANSVPNPYFGSDTLFVVTQDAIGLTPGLGTEPRSQLPRWRLRCRPEHDGRRDGGCRGPADGADVEDDDERGVQQARRHQRKPRDQRLGHRHRHGRRGPALGGGDGRSCHVQRLHGQRLGRWYRLRRRVQRDPYWRLHRQQREPELEVDPRAALRRARPLAGSLV